MVVDGGWWMVDGVLVFGVLVYGSQKVKE